MKKFPVSFNQWVSENNPDDSLSYKKGWWDYIETLRRLESHYNFPILGVISTFEMGTPPPEEILTMPVVQFGDARGRITVKEDFGNLWNCWTVSVDLPGSPTQDMHSLFDIEQDLRGSKIDGFDVNNIFGSYVDNNSQFTCVVDKEWDVASLFRILLFRSGHHSHYKIGF